MSKLKIEEIIVVEGKDDTRRIQEVVDADTIETIGSAINEEILAQIELAQETRGVIVFTDPDFSGEKIRKKLWKLCRMLSTHSCPAVKQHRKNVAIVSALSMPVMLPSCRHWTKS